LIDVRDEGAVEVSTVSVSLCPPQATMYLKLYIVYESCHQNVFELYLTCELGSI